MKRIINHILAAAILTAFLTSCNDWLDIQPSDRIAEENNFSSQSGFKKALNGVYVELNRDAIYGRNLSCGFVEVLAQRYGVSDENKSVKEYMLFRYDGSDAKSIIQNIWNTSYTLIANINAIISNAETHKDVLTGNNYRLICGEALALRAYLHFDLFRLFGPVYDEESTVKTIPYRTLFSLDVEPQLTPKDFFVRLEKDIHDADSLLNGIDPVIEYGVAGDTKDDFLKYRNLRMNYYAVQALAMRVYYTKGDDEKALEYAKKVIEVQESHFPWIKPGRLTAATPDRVFTSEVIFGLQNLQRNNLYTSLFDGSNLKLSTLLAPRTDVAKQIFENDQVDYRYSSSLKNQVEISGTQYSVFNKYQGESSDSLCNQLIPMLRVSEAYLIAAELSTVKSERLAYLNEFRNHRGIRSQDFADDYDIKIERRKEFWGEGQLWFWYKRRQMTSIKDAISAYGETKISVDKYVLPIPDSETKYN